jgi:queuosine precursor transporter
MYIRKFDLLLAIYICCIAITELMSAKTVPLLSAGSLHLTASVSLLVVPLLFTINDVIVEVHGKERARSVVFSGLIVIALLMGMALLATHLPPSARFAANEPAYDTIFGQSARIAAASLVAFALAEVLDVWVFSKIRERLGKKALWLRNNVSNFAAQLVDTVLFMSLAFYALDKPFGANVSFLVGLMLPYWLLKCAMSVIETPFVYLGVRWLRGPNTTKEEL